MKQNINILLKNVKKRSWKSRKPEDFESVFNNLKDIYKNIKEYNPRKTCDVLIIFDDMIAGMITNKR